MPETFGKCERCGWHHFDFEECVPASLSAIPQAIADLREPRIHKVEYGVDSTDHGSVPFIQYTVERFGLSSGFAANEVQLRLTAQTVRELIQDLELWITNLVELRAQMMNSPNRAQKKETENDERSG